MYSYTTCSLRYRNIHHHLMKGPLIVQLRFSLDQNQCGAADSDGMTATQEGPPAAHLQGKDDKVL